LLELGYDIRTVQEPLGHEEREDDHNLYTHAHPRARERAQSGGCTPRESSNHLCRSAEAAMIGWR
jgi:site-specific recombinase XerD